MSEQKGIRLQVVVMLLSILQTIVLALGAFILNDIHDRVVRLENLNLGGTKNEKANPVVDRAVDSLARGHR